MNWKWWKYWIAPPPAWFDVFNCPLSQIPDFSHSLSYKQIVCSFIMTQKIQMMGNCHLQYQQIELEWQHCQCHELRQYTWQEVWAALSRSKASLHLLLPPQAHNHLHHSKKCMDQYQKWSRSDFQGHTAQLYQYHHLHSWEQWLQWPSPPYVWFSWAPCLLHHVNLSSLNFCDVHMMIRTQIDWWKYFERHETTAPLPIVKKNSPRFCAIPHRYFWDCFGWQTSHVSEIF